MARGALESQALVVPVGGWTAHVDDNSAVYDVTVAAGTYSPRTLLVAFEAACEAASAATWSASIDLSEGGTGRVTLNCTGGIDITWTSTDLRDALGWAADVAVAGPNAVATSDYGIKGLWLPDCPMSGAYGAQDPGHTEGGPTQTVSPLGVTKTIVRPTRVKMPGIRWSHVSAARARQAAESGVPRSWERFVRETMFGAVSYFRPGGAVRLIWNADSPGTYTDYYPIAPRTTATEAADAQWRGLYAVEFAGYKL